MPSPFFCIPSSPKNHPACLAGLVVRSDSPGFTGGSGCFVPQVTCGAIFSACSSTVMSNFAPSSVAQLSSPLDGFPQRLAARHKTRGASRSANAVIGPCPRMRRLRCSCCKPPAAIDSARMASPPYSAMCRVPPPMPIFPMIGRLNVFCGDAFRSLSVHENVQRLERTQTHRFGSAHVGGWPESHQG